MNDKTGIYIHIPFCKSKCRYCDFISFANMQNYMEEYTNKICEEIENKSINKPIDSIFIGGGTPTTLRWEMLEKICYTVLKKGVKENFEFTVEINPDTVDKEYLMNMKRMGINRISFGLQSCVDDTLKFLGRSHSYEVFERTYKNAREVGFNNINIDLMYNLPNQDLENFKYSLEKVLSLKPEHISAYSLIIEEGTPFHKMLEEGKIFSPDEELYVEFNELCEKMLREAGYLKYEVSNYAKVGYECNHNVIYWELDDYYGFGLNAHSKVGNCRYSNTENLIEYLEGNFEKKEEFLSIEEQEEEFIFLGLRMVKGIDKKKYEEIFKRNFDEKFGDRVSEFCRCGYIEDTEQRVRVTSKGFHILNHIIEKIVI